jgi:hypothetical protein
MHAFVDQAEHRLVVQLVVPALEFLAARDLVHQILRLPALRRWPQHAELQLGGMEAVLVAPVVTHRSQQQGRIRAVVADEVAPGRVLRREQPLREGDHHVFLREAPGCRKPKGRLSQRASAGRQGSSV